jgi:UDP-N-acetylglucosamine 3-dehydrogenase
LVIRVGLLGGGFMGATHAAAYAQLDGVKICGVVDSNTAAAEKLATPLGAKVYPDMESLLAGTQIDMVDVCLPTFLHETSLLTAIEHGKHVLCEKPLALSLESADRILSAARRAGVKAMVAQVIRFWPEYICIRDALASGSLGLPRVATAVRLAAPPAWGSWFSNPQLSGGALLDLHIHDLDFVYSLFGKPNSVHAVGFQGTAGGWDHILTTLEYPDKVAHIEASHRMPPRFPFQMAFRLTGDRGCVDFHFGGVAQVDQRKEAQTELVIYTADNPPEHPVPPTEDGYLAEIRYFVHCLQVDRHPEIATLEQARDVLAIAFAAERSLEIRKRISV